VGIWTFLSVQTGSPAIAGQKQARNMVLLAAGILMNFVGGVPCIKALRPTHQKFLLTADAV